MISTNAEVFKKNKRKINILLVIGIIFLLGSLVLLYLGLENSKKKIPDPINILEAKNENTYSYIDVSIKPHLFAVYEVNGKEEDAKYYLVMDKDNHLYIVYMNNDNYKKLNIDSINETPIRIKGISRSITYDLKKQAIDSYNEFMKYEYLTKENFKENVGEYYLDMKTKINDSTLYCIGTLILGILSLLFIVIYIIKVIKNKKTMNELNPELLIKIDTELSQIVDSEYQDMKFYLLKDYLVDFDDNIVIIPYSDILWIYPYDRTYNGLLVNKYLKVTTINNKVYAVAKTRSLEDNKDEILEEIENKIKEKNEEIIIGYSKENKKKVKEIIKDKKNKSKFN